MKKGESTKRNIADAFKKLLKENDFDSITITDITDACDINRLTFYYHFKDKYDLLNWIFYTEVIQPVRENIDADNWAERLLFVLKQMRNNKDYYDNVISYERMDFRNYMFDVSKVILEDTLNAKDKTNVIDEKNYLVYFLAFSVSGAIFDWAAHGMKETPEELTENVISVVMDCDALAVQKHMADIAE